MRTITLTNQEELTVKRGDILTTQFGERIIAMSQSRGICVTIDRGGNLKSRLRDNLNDLIDGYEIRDIKENKLNAGISNLGTETIQPKVGTIIQCKKKDGSIVYRYICGGLSYGEEHYFTIEPGTFIIKSNMYNSLDELILKYNILDVMIPATKVEAEEEYEENDEDEYFEDKVEEDEDLETEW